MQSDLNADDLRQHPSDAFIEELRRRFPTDKEVDVVLTRKMQNRAKRKQGYTPVTLDELVAGVSKLLEAKISGSFSIAKPRWLSGGASMLQMAFELTWQGESGQEAEHVTPMVLRMSPMEPVVESSFLREAEIVKFIADSGIMPVAPSYWIDEEGVYLPYPAIIYGFVTGVAKPTNIPSTQVTGVGLNFGPELREKLAPQVVEHIAKLHAFDASAVDLPGFDKITAGSNDSVIKEINWWHRVWEEDRGEDEPLIQIAANWLKRNAPVVDHVSIIHNDMRSGNFLFDESKAEVTAWLDWELVTLGDRHQDLGWLTAHQFGHFAEDGKTFLASGLMPKDEMLAAYEKATGLPVDPVRMKYYDVMNTWKAAIIVMGTGYRVANGGKSHQDIVVSWLSAIGYLLLAGLTQTLKEAKA
ncbi:putative aminoglycoside phosphotransferase [Spongiibacter sp. IMCC21906]|uniref:phosphotransferase family protein n=1 Tax=Spongiibacter sp. IMCC21906 TaxID=1620392 RepID=UPI00062E0009|nr:phosphotransferase family protein [Spongiibacter sp. IMCC21906]AKH69075.1 putative aminoglycoside phosphotransferase [Spongiibacter sp. IMCC21906]